MNIHGVIDLETGATRMKEVLVPVDDWRRLQEAARPSLKELLLSDRARAVEVVPDRGGRRRRGPPTFA